MDHYYKYETQEGIKGLYIAPSIMKYKLGFTDKSYSGSKRDRNRNSGHK